MVITNNVKWFDYQTDTLKGILSHPSGSRHIIKAKRQVGKSVMCESLVLWYAISYSDKPTFNVYVSPSLKQARKVFKELVQAIQYSSIFWKANESLLEIRLKNNSVIQFASAEQGETNLAGYTVTGVLIIDESAYIPDSIFYAIQPIVDANGCNIVCISTPRYRVGWYYELYKDGLNNVKNIYSYDWAKYDTSELLSPERLEYYKTKYPKSLFEQFYLGLFTSVGDGVFGDFTSCIYDKPKYNGEQTVMGIDWSAQTGNDDTSISIFNLKGEMIDIIYFNNKTEKETINIIIDLCRKYNTKKIQVETNSIGQIYYNLLRNSLNSSNITIKGFNTNNISKQKIVQNFQVAIQNNKVKIIKDDKLLAQLSDFQSKLTATGKVTYAAAGSGNDDLVLSTLFAYDLLRNGSYNVI